MSADTQLRTNCPECVRTNGWHTIDDGIPEHPPKIVRCPNRLATEQLLHARELTAAAREKAMGAAKQIILDVARSLPEISGNDTRLLLKVAEVPEQVIGPAFHALSKGENPALQATGRYVMSTDPATRHRLVVWASLVYRGRAA